MSTFLGMVSGAPLLHMTSDTRTQAQMQGGPISTTIFHSDLPYIFVKNRFTLDTYSTWGDTSGGRTFALSTDLKNYWESNLNLAYLIIVEQSDGSQSIINPMLQADGRYFENFGNSYTYNAIAAINGADYCFAFTTSDSQLSAITRGNTGFPLGSTINYTFRPFGSGDTRITIFRTPFAEWFTSSGYVWSVAENSNYYWANAYNNDPNRFGRDLVSSGNDATKVHIVFLNVNNSVASFNRLPDKTGTDINIEIDDFDVGGVDMLANTPLISRGVKAAGTTVTPLIGTPVGGKTTGISSSNVDTGFVSTSNVVSINNTPVLEIPDEFTSSQTMEIDFLNKTIKRDGNDIFTSTTAASGLRVIGTKEVTFTPATGSVTEGLNTYRTMTNTQTGSYTETPDADTIYLANTVYDDQKLLSSTLMTVGDNPVFHHHWYYRDEVPQPTKILNFGCDFMITIDSSGNITPRAYVRGGLVRNLTFGGITFGDFKVRLIALAAN